MLANETAWRSRGRGPRRAAAHLGGDAGVRRERLRARGHAAGRAEGAAARAGAVPRGCAPSRTRPIRCASWTGSTCSRSRSTRRTRPAAAWSPRRPTARPASSRRCCTTTCGSCPGASDDGVVRFLLDRRRDRRAVQGERVDLRRRGRLPGRGRLGLLDGRRRAVRGARRHAASRSRTPPRSAWSTTSA